MIADSEDICAACLGPGPLYRARCEEKPERLKDEPIGMYHCPDCGAMIVAGLEHPWLCEPCNNRAVGVEDGNPPVS